MWETKEIFNLTDKLSEAIDNHDREDALEVVDEIQNYLDSNSVEDAAYYDAVDRLEEVTTMLDTDNLTRKKWVKVSTVAHQIDEFYLRHHRKRDNSEQSMDKIQVERDLFREKAIQYIQDVDELIGVTYDLMEAVETQSEQLDDFRSILENKREAQQKRINHIATDIVDSDDDKIINHLEEAKDQLEHGDNQEAEEIISNTREKIENGEYHLTGYPTPPFASRLQMAESDAQLGRTTVLENLLSDYKDESDQDR